MKSETDPTIRALLADAEIEIEVRQDDTDLRGNVLASGDDEEDRKAEQEVARRLDAGDVWAWALVRVVAKFDGFEGDDYLGGCNYASEEDFRTPGGYFDDMRRTAVEALAQALESSGFYGSPGSVSTGTLRLDDLADAFASTLDDLRERRALPPSGFALTPEHVAEVGKVDRLLGEIEGAREALGDDWADSEHASEQVEALREALDAWAPPGYSFGAHEGDGADFGFWANVEESEGEVESA